MNSLNKKEKALLIAVFRCVWLFSNAMRGVGFKLFLYYHFKSLALSFDELMREFTLIFFGKGAFDSQLKRVVGVFSSLFRPIFFLSIAPVVRYRYQRTITDEMLLIELSVKETETLIFGENWISYGKKTVVFAIIFIFQPINL